MGHNRGKYPVNLHRYKVLYQKGRGGDYPSSTVKDAISTSDLNTQERGEMWCIKQKYMNWSVNN